MIRQKANFPEIGTFLSEDKYRSINTNIYAVLCDYVSHTSIIIPKDFTNLSCRAVYLLSCFYYNNDIMFHKRSISFGLLVDFTL